MYWDKTFLRLADRVRKKSKDPSSKIGVVIVGPGREIISSGFNSFPDGVKETPERWERPIKYEYIVHAEVNAISRAAKYGRILRDSTLYLVGMGPPTAPCIGCTKTIIQSGIKRVVGAYFKPVSDTWIDELLLAEEMLTEAGVRFNDLGDLEELLRK